ncbi:MAG TPA: hypothetical protein PK200_08645, partial [Spirochaetota bacterium]|nr:hypothetical protein [Spirochaetota bacterium]
NTSLALRVRGRHRETIIMQVKAFINIGSYLIVLTGFVSYCAKYSRMEPNSSRTISAVVRNNFFDRYANIPP